MINFKNIFSIILKINLILLIVSGTVSGQSPEMISYQAVIRNAENVLVADRTISIKLSIMKGSDPGMIVYSETHSVETNHNGLISIQLGNGTQKTGSLGQIEWSKGPYFLKTETDPEGNNNYTITGISQILSVPYALHAKSAENVINKTQETDPVFSESPSASVSFQKIINWDHAFYWGNHKDAGYLTNEIDGSLENELQDLNSVLQYGNSADFRLIKNLGTPEEENDAATKAYVDELEKKLKNTRDTLYGFIDMLGSFLNANVKKTEDLEKMLLESGQYKISDIEGNLYRVVKIGDQYWMAENLKTTRYNDGSPIPLVSDNAEWQNSNTDSYCWYSNDKNLYFDTYGALYNIYAIKTEKLCPEGWHVSNYDEWNQLCNYIGGFADAGGKLKEVGINNWQTPNAAATDSYKFTSRPGGYRGDDGFFYELGRYGYWWGPHYNDTDVYQSFIMGYNSMIVFNYHSGPKNGYSVRCVKDQ